MLRIKILVLTSITVILGPVYLSSQSRWVHEYHDETDSPLGPFIESYDHGYMLLGKVGANYSKYNWLIKTDINGQILWEKTIGDGIHTIALLDLKQDSFGNNYLCGLSNTMDPEQDPLLIKLDSCGNKQWCEIFYTENNYDYARALTVTHEGDVIIILESTNPELWVDPICIAKLSTNGELIWKQCYTTSDTNQQNEITNEIICTPDQGFLVTGYCYYQDPTYPNHWILHPYFLKVDSIGNFEWETVIFKETNLDGGSAWNTVISPDGKYYYPSICHYLFDDNQRLPALAKLDLQGNVVGVYDVINNYKYGFLLSAKFINDSTLAGEASWGDTEDETWPRAVIIDTLGNLLNSTVLTQDIYGSIMQITYDGKLVYGSNTEQNGQFDCYLTKLNQNLEDDTLYTRPFTYDSLCPYKIVSDTIVQDDCGLIVGVEEPGSGEAGKRGGLEIWPNPAREVLSFKVLGLSSGIHYYISIYDIFGREIQKIKIPDAQDEVSVNIESYSPGVYIAILKKGFDLVESRKFVVAK